MAPMRCRSASDRPKSDSCGMRIWKVVGGGAMVESLSGCRARSEMAKSFNCSVGSSSCSVSDAHLGVGSKAGGRGVAREDCSSGTLSTGMGGDLGHLWGGEFRTMINPAKMIPVPG